jgi:hypothetical protein
MPVNFKRHHYRQSGSFGIYVGKEVIKSPASANPASRVHMSISKCVVRLKDSHDTEHSAVVYAESLYEAVLRGLNQLADVGWESSTDETINQVEVEIFQEPTRHTVNVPNLLKWIQQGSGSPAQQTRKEKLRKLLGTR